MNDGLNFLVVMADQLPALAPGCYGNAAEF